MTPNELLSSQPKDTRVRCCILSKGVRRVMF